MSTEAEAPSTVGGRWQANWEERMNWAFDAYQSLLTSLSSDVRARMASAHPEAYVVVFGRTQVGKTTLLLELMGVDPVSLNRVSYVLRGGRGKGQSATATVMEYGRSTDSSWSLQMPNQSPKRYADDVSACAALGDLRHLMESQRLHLAGPVRLEIPIDCFLPLGEGNARVRMLDLPGDQAANPVEQRYVEQVAERYVAGADLILLVGKMDDLSFLKPGGLLLPGIEDWQIVPERFRIITTYSFTAGSVQDAVRKSGLKIEQIRQRLLEQLETFGRITSDARRTDLLFPLEFGQSLERTAQHDPELVSQIEPVVYELKAELVSQINAATTPMARLRTALRSHFLVAKVREQKLHELDAKLEGLVRRLKLADIDLEAATKAAQSNTRRYEKLAIRQESLLGMNRNPWVSALRSLNENMRVDAVGRSVKSVTALQACIDDFRNWLRQNFLSLNARGVDGFLNQEWFWRKVHPDFDKSLPKVRRLLDEHLGFIESRLNEYVTDKYWLDSNFEKDVAVVQSAMKKATAVCRALASVLWRNAFEQQLRLHQQALQDANLQVSLDKQLLLDLKARAAAAQDAVHKLEVQRGAFEIRMAADQERCQTFAKMLDDSYSEQLSSMLDRLRCSNNPSFALIDLISCNHLIETRSKLLATGSPPTTHSV